MGSNTLIYRQITTFSFTATPACGLLIHRHPLFLKGYQYGENA
jgi:hypothetical protein